MDMPLDNPTDEIRRLKACISDLVGVFGLRAVWSGGDPSRIVGTLLDVLVGTLRLDFAYARFQDPMGGASVEAFRGNREGEADVSTVVVPLGLQDEMGTLVAGSRRTDFPLQTERLLLNVAANQAAMGLHEGRRLAERAMQLAAANEELSREIAERKRSEAQRFKLEERLRQAEKMEAIGRFASGIAHDFNGVLAGILAYGEMLVEEVPEGCKRYAHNVMIAATRGHDLVGQILAFTRDQRARRTPTDVSHTVAEALELTRSSLPGAIALHAAIPQAPLVIMGNATQLHQVVMNLCSNAVHAMAEGGLLRVAVTALDVDADRVLSHGSLRPGRYACVSVEDGGCGMDEATLARIFEPFFTTKEVGYGTGLGLALVYAIVADFGGVIDVRSTPGKGSALAIHLPLTESVVPVPE